MSVKLEDETRILIKEIFIMKPDLGILLYEFGQDTKLLKYIDPYGDTIFNRIQMDDLITELSELLNTHGFKYPNNYLKEIIELAIECKNSVHKYIRFYGD